MITDAQERLLQDVLDGAATASERTELTRLLGTDAAVRARHDELEELKRLLEEAASFVPPAGLHERIMRAIRAEPSYGARGGAASRGRRSWLPMLGGFLAGTAAATLVIISILRPDAGGLGRGSALSGTFAPAGDMAMRSSASLATPGGRIELASHRAGDQVRLEIRSHADRPVDLEIEAETQGLQWTGLSWSRSPARRVSSGDGRVMLYGLGPGAAWLTFTAKSAADVPLRVRAGGQDVALLHTGATH